MATATKTKPKLTPEQEELRSKLQVKSPDEFLEWMNILIYGEPGVGKTFFIGQADRDPRLRPVLIFDVEGGMMTLRDRPGIDVIRVRSIQEVEDKYNMLYHSLDKNGELYYKTIGIDSLTELADLDMRKVMKEAFARKPETVDIDVPSPREWGIVRNHIRLIARAFKDLPCHAIYTASENIVQKENMPDKFLPGFAGKLVKEVPGFADIVGHYRARNKGGEINRVLQVTGTDRVLAKDRTKVLGQSVENPTLSSLWGILEGVKLEPEEDIVIDDGES